MKARSRSRTATSYRRGRRPAGGACRPTDDPVLVAPIRPRSVNLAGRLEDVLSGSATGTAAALKDQLLKVRVPAEYRDWHLAFFFAINDLSSAAESGDQRLIESSRTRLEEVISKAGWLKDI